MKYLLYYLYSIPLWIALYYAYTVYIELTLNEMSKLLFGIGEKIIFSSMAVASKGIYDVSIKHTNSVDFGNDYLIISFSVFLFGVYLIQMSKKLKENKHGSS